MTPASNGAFKYHEHHDDAEVRNGFCICKQFHLKLLSRMLKVVQHYRTSLRKQRIGNCVPYLALLGTLKLEISMSVSTPMTATISMIVSYLRSPSRFPGLTCPVPPVLPAFDRYRLDVHDQHCCLSCEAPGRLSLTT